MRTVIISDAHDCDQALCSLCGKGGKLMAMIVEDNNYRLETI